MRVGLVGCGTIGARVALALQREFPRVAQIVALHDADPTPARRLSRRLRSHPPSLSLPALVRRADLIIEAASIEVAPAVVREALRAHRQVLVMSVGGLVVDASWRRALARSRGRVHIPSGALAGLDGVRALAVGRLRRLTLTTRKPPRALAAAAYVRRRGWRLDRLVRPKTVFAGSPAAVIRAFPQNTNVAAALALASGLPQGRIRVRLVADPGRRRNVHQVDAVGDGGRITCRVESRPSTNPKTSELAVRSAIAAVRNLLGTVHFS